jgi:hypothetical protein
MYRGTVNENHYFVEISMNDDARIKCKHLFLIVRNIINGSYSTDFSELYQYAHMYRQDLYKYRSLAPIVRATLQLTEADVQLVPGLNSL